MSMDDISVEIVLYHFVFFFKTKSLEVKSVSAYGKSKIVKTHDDFTSVVFNIIYLKK